MSEFKTFGLPEAQMLFLKNVGVQFKDQHGEWNNRGRTPMLPHSVHRLTPEQELTFEQACLLVGLGLWGELEEDCTNEETWRDSFGSLSPAWLYRTRPLTKQTKIIPHTMETAPEEASVRHPDYGIGLAVPTNSGRLFVDWAKGPAMFYPFDKALDELTIVDRFGPNTGKPYGMEVEA